MIEGNLEVKLPIWTDGKAEVDRIIEEKGRRKKIRKGKCRRKKMVKSKCVEHLRSGALLDIQLWKKYTRLWCEAYFEVNMLKTHSLGALLEVERAA
jgi:hypothetical protein